MRRSESSGGEPKDPPASRADRHELAFRDPSPIFRMRVADAQHQEPLLFVHFNAASTKQPAKPRAPAVRRDVRSHVRFYAHDKKRRDKVEKAERLFHQGSQTAAKLDEHTIWSISMGNIDPFDTMPAKETPAYRRVVEFYFFDMPMHIPYSGGIVAPELRRRNPPPWARSFWRLAKLEPAAFFATIWYTAVVYSVMRGEPMNAEFMSWERQARDGISKWIASGSPISDSIATAVCCLAMCANNQGLHDVSDLHYRGLTTIVNARGGLDKFEPFTQCLIVWSEFCFHMRCITVPKLYQELSLGSLQQWRERFPLDLQREALLGFQRSQLRLPLIAADLGTVLHNLHYLSIAQHPEWAGRIDRACLRHLLYDSEYRLLFILVETKAYHEGSMHASDVSARARVRCAVAQAAQLFLLVSLSEMPFRRELYDSLVERLKRTLSVSNLIDQWALVAHLHSLVWVLFIGWALAGKGVNATLPQEWFGERLRGIMWQLDLRCEDLEKLLTQFPFTGAIWKECWEQLL